VPAARRRFDPVDHLLALDPGRRGIAAFFQPGGALRAARALTGARTVLIVTGFIVADGMPETDGPPGAAVLGRALRQLGARVRYTTDAATLPTLVAALKSLGEPADAFAYPDGARAAGEVLARERPTHLVSIERPGRGRGGDYLNARGASVAEWNRPLDEMFLRRGRAVTLAVGDGGNEIGMGNVRRALLREGALMARIASVVRVDHLVVAGVSNWGAYGIVAQLGRLTGRPLLHTAADERRLIEACVDAGAVDGITRRRERTVDGLPADTHAAIVALLGLSWGDLAPRGERR
jgi:D-glutamate cyclase-like protein